MKQGYPETKAYAVPSTGMAKYVPGNPKTNQVRSYVLDMAGVLLGCTNGTLLGTFVFGRERES